MSPHHCFAITLECYFEFEHVSKNEVKNINTHKSPIFEYGSQYKGTDHSNNSSRDKLYAEAETP